MKFQEKLSENFIFVVTIISAILISASLLYINSYDIETFRNILDAEIRTHYFSTTKVFSSSVYYSLDNLSVLQSQIDQLTELPEIKEANVILPKDSKFAIIASSIKENVGILVQNTDWQQAWDKGDTVYTYENYLAEGDLTGNVRQKSERLIKLAYPLKNRDGQKLALISVNFSSEKIDSLVGGYEQARNTRNFIFGFVFIVIITTLGSLLDHRTKLSAKLSEALRSKDDLLALASHELAGPLTNIKGSLSIVLEEYGSKITGESRQLIERAAVSTEELIDLVEDLLVVFRFERGKIEIYPRPAHLEDITTQVIEIFMQQASAKNLELVYDKPKQALPKLIFDPEKIREVLNNFVSNAIKYTEHGKITVSQEVEKGTVVTKIHDTGLGIAQEDLGKLFQRFMRLEGKTHSIKGTGLGLYITKLIVEHHGGKVWVESEVGEGSTFNFSLPIPTKVL